MMAQRLDWLAVFSLAFTLAVAAIGQATSLPDVQALRAANCDAGCALSLLPFALGVVLLTLISLPALVWLALRFVFIGQYRAVKAASLLLCGIACSAVVPANLFLPIVMVIVLLLFLTMSKWQAIENDGVRR